MVRRQQKYMSRKNQYWIRRAILPVRRPHHPRQTLARLLIRMASTRRIVGTASPEPSLMGRGPWTIAFGRFTRRLWGGCRASLRVRVPHRAWKIRLCASLLPPSVSGTGAAWTKVSQSLKKEQLWQSLCFAWVPSARSYLTFS
jgi:hypothetical protein